LFPVSAISCGNPTPIGGVAVRPFNATTVNSIVYYQCPQSGFVPSSVRSVCGGDGMWNPDPSQVTCEMEPPVMTGRLGVFIVLVFYVVKLLRYDESVSYICIP